jgi:hypothetical protein
MKTSTEDNAVTLATNEVDAAIEEHDRSGAAYKRLCRAMSAACKAYADQYMIPSLTLAQVPMQPFPVQAAEKLHYLLEDLLAGHLDPMALSLVGRSGARGRRMWEKAAVEAACKYMQAVKKGWIADHREVARIAELYGVSRATAQSWRRNEKRDLLPSTDKYIPGKKWGSMIRASMLEWADRYSRLKKEGIVI